MCFDPCKKCGQPTCEQQCVCSTPNYTSLGCEKYIPFGCVQLVEKNPDSTPVVFDSINVKTSDTLLDLLSKINQFKYNYDINVGKISDAIPVPTSSTSLGVKGTVTFDSNFQYVCVNTNLWKRIPLYSF